MKINNKMVYDLRIYNKDKIKRAIAAYNKFCNAKIIAEENDKVICEFSSVKIPVNLIINEYDNYLIELMQNNVTD